MAIYIGTPSGNRKVKKIYIGNKDGTPIQVKSVWIGNEQKIPKQFFSNVCTVHDFVLNGYDDTPGGSDYFKCSVCGEELQTGHELSYTPASSMDHFWHCSVCGSSGRESCSFELVYDGGDYSHYECSKCGQHDQ